MMGELGVLTTTSPINGHSTLEAPNCLKEVSNVANALAVAKELANLSMEGAEPDPLTNLRLQKLLYYAQGWSLVTRESELFPETLEAWRNGPVVPEVYRHFPSRFGSAQITPGHFVSVPELPRSTADFVRRVWEAYKRFSATHLAEMTHVEEPWANAWGDRPKDGYGTDPISMEELEAFFSKQDMPGPITAFEYETRRAEEQACELLAKIPQMEPERLAAIATSWSPSARR